jgi:hypothetical protein
MLEVAMESFKASTQYGDWEGTAAADNSDRVGVHEYLGEKVLLYPNGFLLAVSFYAGESYMHVRAFALQGADKFESVQAVLSTISGPIPVREINIELTSEEFLNLFKRFHVMLTWHGLGLEGRDYSLGGP